MNVNNYSSPPREGYTASLIVSSMMDRQAQLEVAREFLADPQNHKQSGVANIVLTGFLVTLAGHREALETARDLEPRLEPIRLRHEAFLSELSRFRNDAAHISERILREVPSRPGQHNPVVNPALRICIGYDRANETVQTGANKVLSLPGALARCRAIIDAARRVLGLIP